MIQFFKVCMVTLGLFLGNVAWQFQWGSHDMWIAFDHSYWEAIGMIAIWLSMFGGLRFCKRVINLLFRGLADLTQEKLES